MVNYKENDWEWEGEIFTCKPGQVVTSLDSIMKNCACDVKVQSVRTALLKLEKWGFLTNVSTKTGRLITIINWEAYQAKEDEANKGDNKEPTKDQQSSNKEPTPIKEVKEGIEGKEEELREGENPTDKESLPVDQVKKHDPPSPEKTDPPQQGEAKPPAPPKPAKKKKPRFTVDLEALDPIFDREVMEKFIEYRRKEKKNPVNTQKKLDIIIENAIACKEMYGYDPNHALLYAMQAGTSGWLITDPDYFKTKKMSFERFVRKLEGLPVEAQPEDDILSPLERRNQENARRACKMMDGMFDKDGNFTGLNLGSI